MIRGSIKRFWIFKGHIVMLARLLKAGDEYAPQRSTDPAQTIFTYICTQGAVRVDVASPRENYTGPLRWDLPAPYFSSTIPDQPLTGFALQDNTELCGVVTLPSSQDTIWKLAQVRRDVFHREGRRSIERRDNLIEIRDRLFFDNTKALRDLEKHLSRRMPRYRFDIDPVHGGGGDQTVKPQRAREIEEGFRALKSNLDNQRDSARGRTRNRQRREPGPFW